MLTRSLPAGGVQRTPASRLTSPSAAGTVAGGAAAGGGTATGPKSDQAPQPVAAFHSFRSRLLPLRAKIHSWSGPSPPAAGDESTARVPSSAHADQPPPAHERA